MAVPLLKNVTLPVGAAPLLCVATRAVSITLAPAATVVAGVTVSEGALMAVVVVVVAGVMVTVSVAEVLAL
jgi:zinc transporter ZupT